MRIIFAQGENSSFGFLWLAFFRVGKKINVLFVGWLLNCPKRAKVGGKNKINSFNLLVTFLRIIFFFALLLTVAAMWSVE
jgi:hypothetical protein